MPGLSVLALVLVCGMLVCCEAAPSMSIRDLHVLSRRQLIRTASPYIINVSNNAKDSAVPDGFDLQDVYFSPTYEQTLDVYAGRQSMDSMLDVFRTKWQLGCILQLGQTSSSFRLSKTFGWFHFSPNTTIADGHPQVASSAVFDYRAGCYETSTYDATGSKPGKSVRDHTGSLKQLFGWTEGRAQQDGRVLDQKLSQLDSKSKGT